MTKPVTRGEFLGLMGASAAMMAGGCACPFGESIEAEVADKVARLRHQRGSSIRTALVYEGELAPVVRGNGYFDAIVSASDLLDL